MIIGLAHHLPRNECLHPVLINFYRVTWLGMLPDLRKYVITAPHVTLPKRLLGRALQHTPTHHCCSHPLPEPCPSLPFLITLLSSPILLGSNTLPHLPHLPFATPVLYYFPTYLSPFLLASLFIALQPPHPLCPYEPNSDNNRSL